MNMSTVTVSSVHHYWQEKLKTSGFAPPQLEYLAYVPCRSARNTGGTGLLRLWSSRQSKVCLLVGSHLGVQGLGLSCRARPIHYSVLARQLRQLTLPSLPKCRVLPGLLDVSPLLGCHWCFVPFFVGDCKCHMQLQCELRARLAIKSTPSSLKRHWNAKTAARLFATVSIPNPKPQDDETSVGVSAQLAQSISCIVTICSKHTGRLVSIHAHAPLPNMCPPLCSDIHCRKSTADWGCVRLPEYRTVRRFDQSAQSEY